jgi:hypothetical protein
MYLHLIFKKRPPVNLHHSTIVNIKGESYRLKEKRKAGLLARSESYTAEPTADNAAGGVQ